MLITAAFGCEVRSPHDVQSDNPLGPSFWIVAVPGDDDSLLSRTFRAPPDTALSLDEQSAPNPCAEKLGPRVEAALPNHYENAIQSRDAAQTHALLASYGFQGSADASSQLLYKIDTLRKVARFDTTEYQACCRDHDCGWGYVQSLVYGQGEYAAGTEVNASAEGNYSVVHGDVKRWFKVQDTRTVKGYIAAVLVAHDRSQAVQACPPSLVWAKLECVAQGELTSQEQLCAHGTEQAKDPMWQDNPQMRSMFRQQQDEACNWLEEHGRPLPPRDAPPVAAAAPPDKTPVP
jgi:hypothetical protein